MPEVKLASLEASAFAYLHFDVVMAYMILVVLVMSVQRMFFFFF